MSYTPANVLDFLLAVHTLKTTKRTGWVRRNVDLPESVSDHMYMMSLMAWLAAPESKVNGTLNTEKAIKIAMVHDLAECIVGDIAPSDNVAKEDKSKMEEEAMVVLKEKLGGGDIAREIVELWREYETQSTREAILIKQIDKFEMVLQAFVYEKNQEINLTEFYESVQGKLSDPVLQEWFAELISRRVKSLPNLPSFTP